MRTTVDIPDALFREIKSTVALRGESIKQFLLRAAKAELGRSEQNNGTSVRLPIVKSKEDSYDCDPHQIAEILDEEDHVFSSGH